MYANATVCDLIPTLESFHSKGTQIPAAQGSTSPSDEAVHPIVEPSGINGIVVIFCDVLLLHLRTSSIRNKPSKSLLQSYELSSSHEVHERSMPYALSTHRSTAYRPQHNTRSRGQGTTTSTPTDCFVNRLGSS